ncbi:hypothetical protein PR001_g29193 [Phytophthora rubi]|nr:hypothetical protein PR001_g29193 [Phytophthora rubi]
MRISIVAVDPLNPAGAWRVAHTRDGSYAHNHPVSDDIRIHVAHRQREARRLRATEATNTDIVDLQVMAGVSSSRIYATMLLSDENTLAIPKDIANAKAARRSKLLANKTSNEALFDMLRDKGFHFSFDIDPESNRLFYLMWAHPATTKLAREFMDLLIVDCTYKTNRYGMPLLNAIILTGLNTILPFAQVWLPGEAEPDYVWAFNKLKELMQEQSVPMPRVVFTDRDLACTNATESVFPESDKMLCHWHIRRNVLAQAKKKFGLVHTHNAAAGRKKTNNLDTDIFMAKFDATVNSKTEREFDERSFGLRAMNAGMGKYLDA